jgi:hypothetical protein
VVSSQREFVCGIEEDPEVSLKVVLEEVVLEVVVLEVVVLEEAFHGMWDAHGVKVCDVEVYELA